MYRIAETESFVKNITKKKLGKIHEKLRNDIYPVLRKDPFYGPNIKKLVGNLDGFYRYRVGNYRLVYTVDEEEEIIFLSEFVHRKNAY
ncbi:MAG: type II toxin-antitoxin system RelE/ParE family toxin [Leptospirales bacterium]